VSSRPYPCSIKRVIEADLGIPLQSDGRTLRHRKDSGDATETFLLVETSIGRQQVYQVLYYLCYFQTDH
jgi:hypothetical protein